MPARDHQIREAHRDCSVGNFGGSEEQDESELYEYEYITPLDCDWGHNGEQSNVDWDRINVEDEIIQKEIHESRLAAAKDHGVGVTHMERIQPCGGERNAKIDEDDFCRKQKRRQALEQQLRLSQRPSERVYRRMGHIRKPAPSASKAVKSRQKATSFEAQDMYTSKSIYGRRPNLTRNAAAGPSDKSHGRDSSAAHIPSQNHANSPSPLEAQGSETFSLGSPELSFYGEASGHTRDPPSSRNTSRRASGQVENPSSSQNSRSQYKTQQRKRQSREAEGKRPRARPTAEKEAQRARNRELARKSEAWEAEHKARGNVTDDEEETSADDGDGRGGDAVISESSNSRRQAEGGRGCFTIKVESDSDSDSSSDSQNGQLLRTGAPQRRQAERQSSTTSSGSSSTSSESESEREADGRRRRA